MTINKFKVQHPKHTEPTKKLFLIYLKALIFLSPLPFGCVGKIWASLFYLLLLILTYMGVRVIGEQNSQLNIQNSALKIGDSAGGRELRAENGLKVKGERFKVEELEDRIQKTEDRISEIDTFTQNSKFKTRNEVRGEGEKVQGSKFNVDHTNNILYEKWIKGLFIALLAFIGLQIIPLPVFLVKIISPKKVEVMNQLMDELPAFTSLSLVPNETLIYGLIVLLYGGFFWVFVNIKMKRREMVSVLKIFVFSATLQTLFGLFKYLQGNKNFFLFFYAIEKNESSQFLTGTLGNANHFAFYLEIIFPLVLVLILVRLQVFNRKWSLKEKVLSLMDENKKVMFYLIFLFLLALGIFLTGSRSGIITLFLSVLLLVFLSFFIKKSGLRKKMVLLIVPLMLFVIIWGGQDTVDKFLKLKKKTEMGTGIGRFIRWPATLNMVKDYGFTGVGFGTYAYSYFLYDHESEGWVTHAHSDFLEVLAEGGAIGAIFFFTVLVLIFISIIRTWWQRRRRDIKLLGLGLMVSLFAVYFHSLFEFSLRIPSNMFGFLLVMALGIKIVNYKRSKFD